MVDLNYVKDPIETRKGFVLALSRGVVGLLSIGTVIVSGSAYFANDPAPVYDPPPLSYEAFNRGLTYAESVLIGVHMAVSIDDDTTTLIVEEGSTVWGAISQLYQSGERTDSENRKEQYIAEEVAWLRRMTSFDLDNVQPGLTLEYSVSEGWLSSEEDGVVVLLSQGSPDFNGMAPTLTPRGNTSGLVESATGDSIVSEPLWQCRVPGVVPRC